MFTLFNGDVFTSKFRPFFKCLHFVVYPLNAAWPESADVCQNSSINKVNLMKYLHFGLSQQSNKGRICELKDLFCNFLLFMWPFSLSTCCVHFYFSRWSEEKPKNPVLVEGIMNKKEWWAYKPYKNAVTSELSHWIADPQNLQAVAAVYFWLFRQNVGRKSRITAGSATDLSL